MSAHGLWIGLTLVQTAVVAVVLWMRRSRAEAATIEAGHAPAAAGDHAFLREAAHTLRTPLAVARGHAELVLTSLEGGTRAHADAVVLLDELRRAARISDQLLVLGTASHSAGLLLAPMDAGALALKAAQRWSATSGREIAVDAAEPVVVLADEARLRHALDALIENALKVTAPDGRIALGAAVVDGAAELTVSDTGAGIAPEDLGRIFDRFERGSAPRGRGTGLGLAIVRAIVEGHGGEVAVESALGRGTTFTLHLGPPLRSEPEPARPQRRSGRSDAAPQVA
jgi:two-component system OmpR family sensor kinase